MSTYVIGDLQGCFESLQALMDCVRFQPGQDRLWFSGDLVSRGPDSLETLKWVKSLGDAAITVLGNHDLHLLALGSGANHKQTSDTGLEAILNDPASPEMIHWLRQRPLLHQDADLGYTMVHAGLPPQWNISEAVILARQAESVLRGPDYRLFLKRMYGDYPDQWHPRLTGSGRLRFIINCFTRLRYCTRQGRLDLSAKGPPGSRNENTLPWFAVPGRRSSGARLVFGHWSTLGRVAWPQYNVWGLDTGCVWGGYLTAMRLEDGKLFSVSCPAYQPIT